MMVMLYHDVSATTSRRLTMPRKLKRKMIILHTTMGYNSLAYLQGGSVLDGRYASADFLIDRLGNIFQITRPGWYAFHSGHSRWRHIQDPGGNLNQSAVGIELEAAEHKGQRITDRQYIACAALLDALMAYHGIMLDHITTHKLVALPPGRKQDPMYLDWTVMQREMLEPSIEAVALKIPKVLP